MTGLIDINNAPNFKVGDGVLIRSNGLTGDGSCGKIIGLSDAGYDFIVHVRQMNVHYFKHELFLPVSSRLRELKKNETT